MSCAGHRRMGIGSGGILTVADLPVQLVGQGRNIVISIKVDFKDILDSRLYLIPKAAAGRRIHKLCSAEKILVMDGDEVRQRTGGGFCGAALYIIIICNGIVPVDIIGERHGLDILGNYRSDGIEVLQVSAVGHTEDKLIGVALALHEHIEHGVYIRKRIGMDVDRCLACGGLKVYFCGNAYVLTRVDVERSFGRNISKILGSGIGSRCSGLGLDLCKACVGGWLYLAAELSVTGKARIFPEAVERAADDYRFAVFGTTAVGVIVHRLHQGAVPAELAVSLGSVNGLAVDPQIDLQTAFKHIGVAHVRPGDGYGYLDNELLVVFEVYRCLGILGGQRLGRQSAAAVVAEQQLTTGVLVTAYIVIRERIAAVLVKHGIDIAGIGVVLDEHIAVSCVGVNARLGYENIVNSVCTRCVHVLITVERIIGEACGVACYLLSAVILHEQIDQLTVTSHFGEVSLSRHKDRLGVLVSLLKLKRLVHRDDRRYGYRTDNSNDADNDDQLCHSKAFFP